MENQTYTDNITTVYVTLMAKSRNTKATTRNAMILIAGLAIGVLALYLQRDPITSLSLFLATFSVAAVLWGGVGLLFGGRQLIYLPTKSPLVSTSLSLKAGNLSLLLSAVKNGDIKTIQRLRDEDNAGLRLDVLYATDNQFMACQFYQYIPHCYEIASEVCEVSEINRGSFMTLLKSN